MIFCFIPVLSFCPMFSSSGLNYLRILCFSQLFGLCCKLCCFLRWIYSVQSNVFDCINLWVIYSKNKMCIKLPSLAHSPLERHQHSLLQVSKYAVATDASRAVRCLSSSGSAYAMGSVLRASNPSGTCFCHEAAIAFLATCSSPFCSQRSASFTGSAWI